MNGTADLIASLSAKVKPAGRIGSPAYWVICLLSVLSVYAIACQFFLGLRQDLPVQLTRPFFVSEVLLLVLLLFTSVIAAVLAMYPDLYQKPWLIKLPYAVFIVLMVVLGGQAFLPYDVRMVVPVGANVHTLACAVCIGAVALIPSALILAILRKGTTVHQRHAGLLAVLAASSIGCLTLRLAEENDSIIHIMQWHYLPVLLFAMFGVLAGKWLLKW